MNFFKKWYTYQKERFPILVYGIYVFSIVFATFFFCNYYRNISQINFKIMIPMFIVAFLQFLMVRIIDEFKDYEDDCKYRSYRPVPRGLIKLNELKVLFIICAILQVIVTFLGAGVVGIGYLIVLWIFFLIMTKGFFIKSFLDKHILIEVVFDELMMPVLVTYLSTFVFIMNEAFTNTGSVLGQKNCWIILLLSYIISCIVEIARKVRCKEDEEAGVKTYTAVYGIPKATLILCALETAVLGIIIKVTYNLKKYMLIFMAIYAIITLINILFIMKKNSKMAKLTELCANIYIMIAYFSMAVLII